MRNLMILAGILVGLGTVMAQMADRITPALAITSARNTALAPYDCAGRRSQPQHPARRPRPF